MGLLEKMSKITASVQNIEKLGYNNFSKYNYVRAVDVIAGVQKELIKEGVYLSISEDSVEYHSTEKNRFARLKSTATFYDIDNHTDKLTVSYFSEASDTLDKAIYKAKTNGLKYLLTQQFFLVTDVLRDVEEDERINIEPKINKFELANKYSLATQTIFHCTNLLDLSKYEIRIEELGFDQNQKLALKTLINETRTKLEKQKGTT